MVGDVELFQGVIHHSGSRRLSFQAFDGCIGAKCGIDIKKFKEVRKQALGLLPGLLVPINPDILSWKPFKVPLDLIVIQPDLEERVIGTDCPIFVAPTLLNVLAK